MFRYTLAFAAALAAAGPAAAGSWADALFAELSKDFGSVPRGPTLTHPFRFKNTTGSTLNVANVRVSCNQCVTAAALQTALNPGEESAIQVRMDTTKFTGLRSVTVFVQFDKPGFEEVRLWVQANARDDVQVVPDTLAFGQVRRGAGPSAATTITFYGNGQARILEAQPESNYVQTSLQELRRQDSEVAYQLTAKLRADAPVGKWFTDVWLKTNNAAIPRVRVPLTIEIESALSVSPTAVNFGPLKPGAAAERKVILRGVKAFKVTGVEGTDAQFTVQDSTEESKPVHVLTVKLKADKAGEWSRTVKVLTDLPDEGQIEFQARAQVAP